MGKRVVATILLIAYAAVLIKVMVLKDLPLITVGHIMLNFGGIDAGHPANFVPFRTIVPYLFGFKGLIIAGINLVGNIILLVPVGFLIPIVWRSVTWKSSLILSIVSGMLIELLQVALHVGIFDIDDVILNALGVMIGFWLYLVFVRLMASKFKAATIVIIALLIAAALYGIAINPKIRLSPSPAVSLKGSQSNLGDDPCGGTGGIGLITHVEGNAFTIQRNAGNRHPVYLATPVQIVTPAGTGTTSDLKTGDRVTLVGGPNPDGSFTADAVFVCAPSDTTE
jgi:glycopeptide antibiotics resistance protein